MLILVGLGSIEFLVSLEERRAASLHFILSISKMYAQQTSFIKRAGQGARREFQVMHLAVFPFQAEFLKTNELETLAYFEKGNQIIGVNGEKPITIPPANKGEKVRLSSFNNIVKFHVYSESNVVYKWSLYRRHASGQEEFLESCAFNLREIVVNYILPLRGETTSMINSTIGNDFHEKQLRGKFAKTGLILNFALIVSNDLPAIENHVTHRYCESLHTFHINTQAIEITNEQIFQVSLMEQRHHDDSFQSASMLSQPSLLKYQSRHDERQKAEKANSEKVHQINSSSHHSLAEDTIALDLDQLILNEEKPRSGNSLQHIVKSQEGDDLTFGVEENETKTSLQAQKIKLELKEPKGRDYSLLRLQSDNKGLRPEMIDDKLERQQLDMIEEERTSMKGTGKASSLRSKPNPNSEKSLFPKAQPQPQPQITIQPTPAQPTNFKKLIIFFIALAFSLMVAAVYNYSIKKPKPKSKPKSKPKG